MILKLTNTVTKQSTEIVVASEMKGAYAFIDLTLPSMDDGEYEYELMTDSETLGKGIAQIGQLRTNNDQYNNEVKYVQYNG